MANRQLTRDGFQYAPGMTLFGACEGQIVQRVTKNRPCPEGYAAVSGIGVPFIHIGSHFASRDAAAISLRPSLEHSRFMRERHVKAKAA